MLNSQPDRPGCLAAKGAGLKTRSLAVWQSLQVSLFFLGGGDLPKEACALGAVAARERAGRSKAGWWGRERPGGFAVVGAVQSEDGVGPGVMT